MKKFLVTATAFAFAAALMAGNIHFVRQVYADAAVRKYQAATSSS